MKQFDYDLVVIGSGAAGGTAAMMAAGTGVKTALIEAGAWGGTNINRRDIPYRAASHFSQTFFGAIEASKFGLSSTSYWIPQWFLLDKTTRGHKTDNALFTSAGLTVRYHF